MASSYILLHDTQFHAHLGGKTLQKLELCVCKFIDGSPMPKKYDVTRHYCLMSVKKVGWMRWHCKISKLGSTNRSLQLHSAMSPDMALNARCLIALSSPLSLLDPDLQAPAAMSRVVHSQLRLKASEEPGSRHNIPQPVCL